MQLFKRKRDATENLAEPEVSAVADIKDPYVQFKQQWDERFAVSATREKWWRWALFASLFVTTIAVIMNVHLSGRAQIEPHIIEVDKEGTILGSYDPSNFKDLVSDSIYRSAMIQWVKSLRLVTPDSHLQREAIMRVQSHLRSGDPVVATVSEIYTKNPPFDRAEKEIVKVEIIDVSRLTPKSWYIQWKEIISSRSAQSRYEQGFSATITMEQGAISDEIRLLNPLGLFIVNFDMREDVN